MKSLFNQMARNIQAKPNVLATPNSSKLGLVGLCPQSSRLEMIDKKSSCGWGFPMLLHQVSKKASNHSTKSYKTSSYQIGSTDERPEDLIKVYLQPLTLTAFLPN